jgi:hypothetical protein
MPNKSATQKICPSIQAEIRGGMVLAMNKFYITDEFSRTAAASRLFAGSSDGLEWLSWRLESLKGIESFRQGRAGVSKQFEVELSTVMSVNDFLICPAISRQGSRQRS